MSFVAIMAATQDNRLAKRADFPTKAEADVHVADHIARWPDAFVVRTPAGQEGHWLIDMVAKTIAIVPPPPPDYAAIDAATVDRLLLESGVTRAQLKTLFSHENRIRVLEGKEVITVGQFKTAFWKLIRGN